MAGTKFKTAPLHSDTKVNTKPNQGTHGYTNVCSSGEGYSTIRKQIDKGWRGQKIQDSTFATDTKANTKPNQGTHGYTEGLTIAYTSSPKPEKIH